MTDRWNTRWQNELGRCTSREERVEWLSRKFETLAEMLAWLGHDELTETGGLVLSGAAQQRLMKALRVMQGGVRWSRRAVSAGCPGTADAELFGLPTEISVVAKALEDCAAAVTVLGPGDGCRSSWAAALEALGAVESSVRDLKNDLHLRASSPSVTVGESMDAGQT